MGFKRWSIGKVTWVMCCDSNSDRRLCCFKAWVIVLLVFGTLNTISSVVAICGGGDITFSGILPILVLIWCIISLACLQEKNHYRVASGVFCLFGVLTVVMAVVACITVSEKLEHVDHVLSHERFNNIKFNNNMKVSEEDRARFRAHMQVVAHSLSGMGASLVWVALIFALIFASFKFAAAWYAKQVADYLGNEGTALDDLRTNNAKAREIEDKEELHLDYTKMV